MKQRPILMSSEMVQAILAGNKTQTRRVIKPQPLTVGLKGVYPDLYNHEPNHWAFWLPDNRMTEPRIWKCPYGQVGDRLWVRESYIPNLDEKTATYKANWNEYPNGPGIKFTCKWKPSIFMPRKYSRITLEITSIKVQQLQNMTFQDIRDEGFDIGKTNPTAGEVARKWYCDLWDRINGKKYPWSSNPWVWVITFNTMQIG